jgi:hypothetical protein
VDRPSVFIGSSVEGLEFARAIRANLEPVAEVTLWNEGFFTLGSTFIESLVNSLPRFDFAVLVLTADDLIHSRNDKTFGPRDNVIFELGLFTGRLGRSRTFIVHQASAQLKIPTDLSGVNTAQYSWPRDDNNQIAAVGAACDAIRRVIRELGFSEEKSSKQVQIVAEAVKKQEKEIQDQGEITRLIHKALRLSLTKDEYQHLINLESGAPLHYKYSDYLKKDMMRLYQHGYVEETFHGSTGEMERQGDKDFDPRKFYRITDEGKEYLELIRKLEAPISHA